jgi:hypothetical protein
MRISSEKRAEILHKALDQIPSWVKEKERRYKKQKALAERVFGDVVRHINKGRK